MVVANLHSRGFDIPWLQQVIDAEWQSFQRASNPPGTPALSEHGRSAPPPRYFQLVQFITQLLSPVLKPGSGANIPEIVTSCHGDIESIMRRLEIVHHIPVPPLSSQSLTSMFSKWLTTPGAPVPMIIDDPLFSIPTPHQLPVNLPITTDHISTNDFMFNAPERHSPVIRIPDTVIRVQPPADLLTRHPAASAALPPAPAVILAALPPAPADTLAALPPTPADTTPALPSATAHAPLTSEQIIRVSPHILRTTLPAAEQLAKPAPRDNNSGATTNIS